MHHPNGYAVPWDAKAGEECPACHKDSLQFEGDKTTMILMCSADKSHFRPSLDSETSAQLARRGTSTSA